MKYSNAKLGFTFRLKYIKVLCLKSIFIFLISSCGYGQPIDDNPTDKRSIVREDVRIHVGAENMEEYMPSLKSKSVGIVANQSSLIDNTHLVDSLLSLGINVRKVYSPEHGFRGDADAGEHISDEKDVTTGLPIVSLYGKNKKPRKDQLTGVDIMIFDIQDVGVRFYTYISTLHYVMEACAESRIPVIVLDRPNPNGHYVDGPVLDPKFTSFVGMHPVPIVHGMTIGEYAKMINGEGWLANGVKCELEVISCKNYLHETPYSLPVPPSPNLRSDISIQLYPSLCLLEATTVSVGRGTDGPFECYGHPDFPKCDFEFTPKSGKGSKFPKHNLKVCKGYDLNDSLYVRMSKLDLSFLIEANKNLNGELFIDREKFFNLLAGNSILIDQITSGKTEKEIRKSWKNELEQFKVTREKYLLYK